MTRLLISADDLLRAQGLSARREAPPMSILLVMLVCFGGLYGALMGTFGWWMSPRVLQVLYSAIKVPILLLGTFSLSLPSFYVLNSLLGLREDLAAATRALLATQAGVTLVLASLAPFTLFWYASTGDYGSAILFNAAMFGTASLSGQFLLRRFYRPLIARNPRHRVLLRMWLVIYAFVGIQMGWLLRPFIGDPTLPTHFLREDAWGNAYVFLARRIWDLLAP